MQTPINSLLMSICAPYSNLHLLFSFFQANTQVLRYIKATRFEYYRVSHELLQLNLNENNDFINQYSRVL